MVHDGDISQYIPKIEQSISSSKSQILPSNEALVWDVSVLGSCPMGVSLAMAPFQDG